MRCRLDAIGVDARRKQDRDERRADRDELTEFAPLGQKDSNPHRMAPKAIVLPLDHVPGSQPRHPTTVRKGFEPLVLVENYSLASCHLQPLGHLTMVSRNAQRATHRFASWEVDRTLDGRTLYEGRLDRPLPKRIRHGGLCDGMVML